MISVDSEMLDQYAAFGMFANFEILEYQGFVGGILGGIGGGSGAKKVLSYL